MKNLYRSFNYRLGRFVDGFSLLQVLFLLFLVILSTILLTKSLFHAVELHAANSPDQIYNPKIIKSNQYSKLEKQPQRTISIETISVPLVAKEEISKMTIYSGPDSILLNVSFNINLPIIQETAMNDILIKELHINSQKLSDSIDDKVLDYDFNARFCKCTKISQPCICCVKLTLDLLGLMKTFCCDITYLAKEKAAKISLIYGDEIKSPYDVLINIDNSPPICMSQLFVFNNDIRNEQITDIDLLPSVLTNTTLELCFIMKNLTYNLMMEGTHRTEFKGCSNVYVRLKDIVIQVYPLGCFLASHDDSKELQIQKVVHGIP